MVLPSAHIDSIAWATAGFFPTLCATTFEKDSL
jgi:hypothetical protein